MIKSKPHLIISTPHLDNSSKLTVYSKKWLQCMNTFELAHSCFSFFGYLKPVKFNESSLKYVKVKGGQWYIIICRVFLVNRCDSLWQFQSLFYLFPLINRERFLSCFSLTVFDKYLASWTVRNCPQGSTL